MILGLIININSIFDPLHESELFDDAHFWGMPSNVSDVYKTEEGTNNLKFAKLEVNAENPKEERNLNDNGISVAKIYPE